MVVVDAIVSLFFRLFSFPVPSYVLYINRSCQRLLVSSCISPDTIFLITYSYYWRSIQLWCMHLFVITYYLLMNFRWRFSPNTHLSSNRSHLAFLHCIASLHFTLHCILIRSFCFQHYSHHISCVCRYFFAGVCTSALAILGAVAHRNALHDLNPRLTLVTRIHCQLCTPSLLCLPTFSPLNAFSSMLRCA